MVKKTITYIDYNGEPRTEDFFFNLNKAELTEMELSVKGGLKQHLEKIVKEQDNQEIVKYFKDLLLRSYGVKSADGKHFVKSKELSDEFTHTQAYSDLFMELSENADVAAAFVNGIIPQM